MGATIGDRYVSFPDIKIKDVGMVSNNKSVEDLHYNTSWDWLMPVIEKVNMVTKYDDYNQNRLHIQRVLNDCINENAVGIDEVCKAVVEFINEYNKRK